MSEDEIDILETFRKLTPENRAALSDYIKAVHAAEENGSAPPGPPIEKDNGQSSF
jgi:hypothetical protein